MNSSWLIRLLGLQMISSIFELPKRMFTTKGLVKGSKSFRSTTASSMSMAWWIETPCSRCEGPYCTISIGEPTRFKMIYYGRDDPYACDSSKGHRDRILHDRWSRSPSQIRLQAQPVIAKLIPPTVPSWSGWPTTEARARAGTLRTPCPGPVSTRRYETP